MEEIFGFDDLKDACGSHHVREVAAPCRIDAVRHRKHIVPNIVDSSPGHYSADAKLLAEYDDVRGKSELPIRPGRARQPTAGLHLIDHEQRIVLMAHPLHRLEEFMPH